MKLPQIIFVVPFFFYSASCQNNVGKKPVVGPQKRAIPSTEYQKKDKSIPEWDVQKPSKEPLDKEVKKKKLRATDTLKPIATIP